MEAEQGHARESAASVKIERKFGKTCALSSVFETLCMGRSCRIGPRHLLLILSWLHTDVLTIFCSSFLLAPSLSPGGCHAEQVLLGRWRGARVAVKILKASVQADTAISANFKEEAKMLCRLSHPNIVEFYGACLTADTVRLANGRSMQE